MLPNKFLQLWHNPSLGMTVTHEMMFMMESALNKFGKCILTFDSKPFIFICVLLTCKKKKKKTAKVIGKCIQWRIKWVEFEEVLVLSVIFIRTLSVMKTQHNVSETVYFHLQVK